MDTTALSFTLELLKQMGYTVSSSDSIKHLYGFTLIDITIVEKIPERTASEILHSIQNIVRGYLQLDSGLDIESIHHLVIDINGHIAASIKSLEIKVSLLANRARTYGINVHMDPLNPFERKIVHTLLDKMPGVRNESEGVGYDRHVVIFPTDK